MSAEEIKALYHIRVHGTDFTVDLPAKQHKSIAVTQAHSLLKVGVWLGDRLYPPSAIVYIELMKEIS